MDTTPEPGTRVTIQCTDPDIFAGNTGVVLADGAIVDGDPLGKATITLPGRDEESEGIVWVQIDREETDPVYAFRLSELTPITDEETSDGQ